MNETIMNLQTLSQALISLPAWVWSLSWGWIILLSLIFAILLPFLIAGFFTVISGYSYSNSTKNYSGSIKNSWLLKRFMNKNESLKDIDSMVFIALVVLYLALHYIPFIPVIKTAIISIAVTYLLLYTTIFISYGFMVRFGMLATVVMTFIMAYYNVDIGLPHITPYYKLLGTVINPTDYDIDFNQIYYIYIMFVGFLWIVAYTFNYFKWRNRVKHEGVINLDEYHIDTGRKKKDVELYLSGSKNLKDKLKQDLNLLCISASTQELIYKQYTFLQINEFLEELRNLENTDNPKKYFLSKLEELDNAKEQ